MAETPDRAGDVPRGAELLEILKGAVSEVFSTMVCAFQQTAMIRPGERPPIVNGPDGQSKLAIGGMETPRVQLDRQASVEFRGALSGQVILRCSAGGAMDIARGLLMIGNDQALAVEEVNDALRECANMVTGVLKSRAFDPHGEFRMGTPEVRAIQEEPGDACGSLVYQLRQGAISVEIWRQS